MSSPPSRVSLAYRTFGHVLLAVAAGIVAWDPGAVVGFFYHPKMVAVVHALTLGWISSSLIAGFYAAAPRALRASFSTGRLDAVVCGGWCLGASGLASHFWIDEWSGMEWSAGLCLAAVVFLAVRFAGPVPLSSLPAGLKAAYGIAWLNFAATALIGMLIGLDKQYSLLPGYSLHNVFAHAHLAAVGWVLPASVALAVTDGRVAGGPLARLLLPGVAAAQLGAVGVFVSLLTGGTATVAFGVVGWVGCALLLAAAAAEVPRGAAARALAWTATVAILGAGAVGLSLGGGTTPVADPQRILLYGAVALLGFGQLVASRANDSGGRASSAAALGWIVAGALLAGGLYAGHAAAVRAGAATLCAALTLSVPATLAGFRRAGCTRTRSVGG